MSKFSLIIISILGISLLYFSACEKEVKDDAKKITPPPIDPCQGKSPVSADFKILEMVYAREYHYVETDTINSLNGVRFRPTQKLDSLTWLIGTEVLHDTAFTRKGFPDNVRIRVTLIGKRKPDKCFPDDDGVDTVTKYFVTRNYSFLPINGKYKLYDIENPNDTFTIVVNDTMYDQSLNRYESTGNITNFPKGVPKFNGGGTPNYGGKILFFTYAAANDSRINTYSTYFGMTGTAVYSKKEITFDCNYDETGYSNFIHSQNNTVPKIVHKVFRGKKY